jgi:murein DD-endopeptidase MepM/ murein hydrolase activator NlpD
MPRKVTTQIQHVVRWTQTRHSILVLSGPESRVRHFSVPGVAALGVVAVCCLGILGGGAHLLGWTSSKIDAAEFLALRSENERLYGQIQDIRDAVAVLEAHVDENGLVEQEFRNLANLQAIPEDVRRLGVGGPQPFSELSDAASPFFVVRQARETLTRINELSRKAHFQGANFQEMVTSLQEARDQLDHIPSTSPVRHGWISSRYGTRMDPFTGRPSMHRGVDFSAWTGTPVLATANGKVRHAGRNGELGLLVEIDHGNGILTRYGHNSKILVKVGQQVNRGDVIAEVGNTGRSTSPHCHYEIHTYGRDENPWRYILDGGPLMSASS